MLVEDRIQKVTYERINDAAISERVIIPTSVPRQNVKAVDVTELGDEDRIALENLLVEYKEYVKTQMNTIFNFETWAEQTQNTYVEPKWRTFKLENLK